MLLIAGVMMGCVLFGPRDFTHQGIAPELMLVGVKHIVFILKDL